jgi:hypothetical protein
MRNRIPEVA